MAWQDAELPDLDVTPLVQPLRLVDARPSTIEPLVFRPHLHPLTPDLGFVYLADALGDPFRSAVETTPDGIVVPPEAGRTPFSLHARWFVEGFGRVWLDADNDGELYSRADFHRREPINLSVAFAETRLRRNQLIMDRYRRGGFIHSSEVRHLHALSAELLDEAHRLQGEAASRRADRALHYALWAGEYLELEKARDDIARNRREHFNFGCETRQYIWAKSEEMTTRFAELFNYATITHYVHDTWYEVFEPREGEYRWGIKDNIVEWLAGQDIRIEGRPLFWFHSWVTPPWLQAMSYDALKRYAERHVQQVVGHYGDRVLHWEVVNEYHDWANVHEHTPEQISELVRLACETTREVNPRAVRILNNCSTWGEYAALGRYTHGPANRPQRTPRKYIQDLIDAGVPFEAIGLQMYFPERSLFDMVRNLELFQGFGKPIYITEIGATSGPLRDDILLGTMDVPCAPYDWHRPWDEALQADWLADVYTLFYSKPEVETIAWYDFADFRTFLPNGGLIRADGRIKPSFSRLERLLAEWGHLPNGKARPS
jgi:endo-1,4-beta-xylanase